MVTSNRAPLPGTRQIVITGVAKPEVDVGMLVDAVKLLAERLERDKQGEAA